MKIRLRLGRLLRRSLANLDEIGRHLFWVLRRGENGAGTAGRINQGDRRGVIDRVVAGFFWI
jgi:hypothetical protein